MFYINWELMVNCCDVVISMVISVLVDYNRAETYDDLCTNINTITPYISINNKTLSLFNKHLLINNIRNNTLDLF